MFSRILLLLLAAIMGSHLGCSSQEDARTTIAVIPKGTSHEFWQTIHAGAVKAATELDVEIIWIGPEKEDDRQQQIALVDNQIMSRVDGIVLAPLDVMALRRPVRSAADAKIPVVIFDSDLQDSQDIRVSFVATDNFEGGKIAGREMGDLLNGTGKVVLLRYAEGSASTEKREAGFLEALGEFADIEVVSDEQYAGATTAMAQQASENLLLRFSDGRGGLSVDGIFCVNESSTFGMLQALRRQRLAGKVTFIGFDASPPLIAAMKEGEIQGLVVQNPFHMGYLGVKTMVQHLRGEAVQKRIDTGVTFIQASDLSRPDILEIIQPDLEKWLSR